MSKLTIFLSLILGSLSSVLPHDFKWGVSASAYQTEGAWNISGRGPCIWDYFQTFPGRVYMNETGEVADDFYHRYPGDVQILKSLGVKHFRLSLSWSRLLPTGDVNNINQAGVDFYNSLFDTLINAGITPWVCLIHSDLPQAFNNFTNTSTWLDPGIVQKFNDYADFCFKTFGNKIKYWVTINEIRSVAWLGFGTGIHAPGRCSPSFGDWCEQIGGGGDSSTEPYIAAHHALLAHGYAVNTYKTKYQKAQGGKIGMTIDTSYVIPWNISDPQDHQAVDISLAFQYGWLADPQVFGRYPTEMTSRVTGGRLPTFNETESKIMKGSFDFLGVNYYTTYYVHYTGIIGDNYGNDGRYWTSQYNASGHLIGPQGASSWLFVYPPGIRGLLRWVKNRYNNVEMYVLENGVSIPGENLLPPSLALNDTFRMNYIFDHVMEVVDSVLNDRINVKGYFVWTLLDNFEWTEGYHIKFGMTYVNFNDSLTRTVKDSGYMYANLIQYLGSEGTEKKEEISLANRLREYLMLDS